MQTYIKTEEVQAFQIAFTHGNMFYDRKPPKDRKLPREKYGTELPENIVNRYTPKVGQYLSFQNGQFHGVHAATFFEANYELVEEPPASTEPDNAPE